jgi:mannose/cellobiose epimerase-like protein (N-acyl-D-glucosamine 2-epimerase family)
VIGNYPQFRDRAFLIRHIESILAFYHPRCIDRVNGGFFQHFRDDGSVYDADTRHLVSSTRFVFNYAMAAKFFGHEDYREAARHGLEFLRDKHRNSKTGGYAWVLNKDRVIDATNHCYGLAFVVLAYATAIKAGITEARDYLEDTWALMNRHLWSERDGLYKDEISSDWQIVSSYRGQNANMHTCEAMLAAFEATREPKYLDRAHTLARRITVDMAAKAKGLIWEHYDEHWAPDWEYNKDDPKHLFRPWGFQPGHQTEWAKLLLILERHRPEDWLLPRAKELFGLALERAWDGEYSGICYSFDPEGHICDGDKYLLTGSKLVMVLGHSKCGAVMGACDGAELGNLTALLAKIKPAVDAVEDVEGERNSNTGEASVARGKARRSLGVCARGSRVVWSVQGQSANFLA